MYLFKMATFELFLNIVDLQKNLEMEKKKFEKVKETLTKTEEELKDLKKVWNGLSVLPFDVLC